MVTAMGRKIWTRSLGETEFIDGKVVALAGAFQDITARKDAEAQHRADADAMRDFYDHAPFGYFSRVT